MSASREPLSRDGLTELIGADRITDSPAAHRDRVRALVFGLGGDAGRDRYDSLLQLLHTLRAPDVGNRIDEGRLPQILLESLPPLQEDALSRAGEQLDGLTETRAAQERLEHSAAQVAVFLLVYRRYAAQELRSVADAALEAADAVTRAEEAAGRRAAELGELEAEFIERQAQADGLADELMEIEHALAAIKARAIFRTADDLVQRDRAEAALGAATDQALAGAERERASHARAAGDADDALGEARRSAAEAATVLSATRGALQDAGLPVSGLPREIRTVEHATTGTPVMLRTRRDGDLEPVTRPAAAAAEVVPADNRGRPAGRRGRHRQRRRAGGARAAAPRRSPAAGACRAARAARRRRCGAAARRSRRGREHGRGPQQRAGQRRGGAGPGVAQLGW